MRDRVGVDTTSSSEVLPDTLLQLALLLLPVATPALPLPLLFGLERLRVRSVSSEVVWMSPPGRFEVRV